MTDWTGDEARRGTGEPTDETAESTDQDAGTSGAPDGSTRRPSEPSPHPATPPARSNWFDPPARTPHETPNYTPAPSQPAWLNTSTAGWAGPTAASGTSHDDPTQPHQAVNTPGAADHYSPEPETRPAWPSDSWSRERSGDPWTRASDTSGGWYQPVAPEPIQKAEVRPVRTGVTGSILATALIAAVLASSGTFLALNASGALTPRVTTSGPATGTNTSNVQPLKLDESSAIIDVASKVGPAVVVITSNQGASTTDPFSIPETGVGSGVIYDSNGWILTNRHVVAGSDDLTVTLKDGREFSGRVYGVDSLTDLAIVKIEASGLPIAAIGNSDELKVGQLVVAIGSPLGTFSNTVTSGIVSAKGRSIAVDDGTLSNLIQTDTAINPGNSGGPLLDATGNVIGINTAIARSANGIGFAIPINIARPIMEQAVAGDQLARPWIGIVFTSINVQVAQTNNLPVEQGALISGRGAQGPAIVPGSPAAQAGLREGDIVTSIEGVAIDIEHPLDAVLTQFAPGRTVTLEILRDGETRSVQVTLGTRPANP
jgi:S1-C subfamily serine protease